MKKKKIAILGSTGSIGQNLIRLIKKDTSNFEIVLLTAHKNYKKLLDQSKLFNVKNLIISDEESYKKFISFNKNKQIRVFKNFNQYNKIFNSKIDYAMCAISGLEGLDPILNIIKYSKVIAIANKESIICGWNLIKKKLTHFNTKLIPVDSEHFSIWFGLNNIDIKNIEKIYITASGGPFLNTPKFKFKNIKISDALNHPNWKMGKKITVDSATMINKLYEIIEAKNIFDIPYKKLFVLIHKNSYIHSIIKFNNGMINIIAHETTMKIPIFNSLYHQSNKKLNTKNIDFSKLNNLDFNQINYSKFPINKILKILPNKQSLFETVLVASNDFLVDMFLKKKIEFTKIHNILIKFLNLKEFNKYKNIEPQSSEDIIKIKNYVHFKLKKYLYNF